MDKEIRDEFDKIDSHFQDLMEFLRDNVVVKDDLKNFATKDDLKNFATKDDLKALEQKMDEGFERVHAELRSMDTQLQDIKQRLTRLEKMIMEDSRAFAKEFLDLRKRVEVLERQLHRLQTA